MPQADLFRPVVLIPIYNHPKALTEIVETILSQHVPVLLVDDGSQDDCAQLLDELAEREHVTLVRLPVNSGKGAACMMGFEAARFAGYTHALQIDADGQHDLKAVPAFLEAARKDPRAFICGFPQYDETVPKSRLWARKLTNFWVHVNAWSKQPTDAMCGFRVYPLDAVANVMSQARLSRRMDFDPDIVVRLIWQKTPVVNLPVTVTYPIDGVSHFDSLSDNVRISCMHAKLCLTALCRTASRQYAAVRRMAR